MANTAFAASAGLALVILTAGTSWLAAGPILTDDLWWHLAMGEFYAEQGPFAQGDPLLHTARPEAPIPHEWLFGVVVHGVDRGLGLAGLRLVHGLAVLGVIALALSIFRRAAASLGAALLATALFLALSWFRLFQLRPDLLSIPATLCLYRLLFEPEAPPTLRRCAAAVALLALWANLHSLFAIAFPLLAAAVLGAVVHAVLAGRAGDDATRSRETSRALRLVGVGGAGLLASGLNPRGFAQHWTFFSSSAETAVRSVVDEWTPFDPFSAPLVQGLSPVSWALMDAVGLAFGIAAFTGAWLWLSRGAVAARRFDPRLAALGFAALAAVLISIRFLWLGFLPLLFLLRVAGPAQGSRALAFGGAGVALLLALAWPAASLFPLAAAAAGPASPRAWLEDPYAAWKYHSVGVAFLAETDFRGNLYNSYGMGGFLAYWLAPAARTFIDGRTEHYPPGVLEDAARLGSRRGRAPGESLSELLDARNVDLWFGIGVPSPDLRPGALCTTEHLAGEPGWLLVSRSVHHALYLRDLPRNRQNLAAIAAWYARQGIPFDPARGLDVARVIREHPDGAAKQEMLPRNHRRLARERRAADPGTRLAALDALALTRALLGLYAEQIVLEREALAMRPDAKRPRRRLVYALLRLGRGQEARREALALRAIDPADPFSRAAEASALNFLEAQQRQRSYPEADGLPPAVYADLFPLLSDGDAGWLRSEFLGTWLHPSDLGGRFR